MSNSLSFMVPRFIKKVFCTHPNKTTLTEKVLPSGVEQLHTANAKVPGIGKTCAELFSKTHILVTHCPDCGSTEKLVTESLTEGS